MNQKALKNSTLVALVLGGAGLFVGCGGSTGGGSDNGGSVFGGGASSGSISIDLVDSQLDVASTTGFTVSLRGANGSTASSGTRITCDSEQGVAIIEPSSGSESTDSNGQISGRIGCDAPGSFRFVCRLPNAGSRSASITVRCGGSIPNGFGGFGGAGGGLGGGVEPGGTDFDSTTLRITSVVFTDAGSDAPTATVDTVQNPNCNSDVPATPTPAPTPVASTPVTVIPEPFTDAFLRFTVQNNSGQTVNISSFRYTVPDVSGSNFTSNIIAVSGNNGLTIAPGDSADLSGFFALAGSGVKTFVGSSTAIGNLGFRNVTLTVSGVTDAGEEFDLSAITGVSLQNHDNCP